MLLTRSKKLSCRPLILFRSFFLVPVMANTSLFRNSFSFFKNTKAVNGCRYVLYKNDITNIACSAPGVQVLENRTKDSKLEMEVMENLEELRELNMRQGTINYEEILKQGAEQEALGLKQQEEDDEEEIR